MTVNITCSVCDGRLLCDACRTAARTLSAAGYHVEHSTRYAALKAAASGSYGFAACIVPVGPSERAVLDAAVSLLSGKRLAIVASAATDGLSDLPSHVAVLPQPEYARGAFGLEWLARTPSALPTRGADDTATISLGTGSAAQHEDQSHAIRRLKQAADASRTGIAFEGIDPAPRLDLLAVLEDEVAWAKASGLGFAIVLAHLAGIASPRPGDASDSADERVRAASKTIERAARATDVISGRGDDFLVVLAEADAAGALVASRRIAAAVASSPIRASFKPKKARGFAAWSVGHAVYPADGSTRDSLLARATASLEPV